MLRRRLTIGFLIPMMLAIAGPNFSASANGLAGAYIDPSYLDSTQWNPSTYTPWTIVSHWIQPWRAYQTTVPASQFINGVGINFNFTGLNPYVTAQMLATHGIKRVRINIGWGNLDYATESTIPEAIIQQLQAAKAWGLRPLIILNDDQAVPCPFTRSLAYSLAAPAQVGATTIQLNDTTGLVAGYCGFGLWSYSYTMNYPLITAIDPTTNTVTLSAPLPISLPSGEIEIDFFKYRPFDGQYDTGQVPDPYYNAAEQAATLSGWSKYVMAIANIAAQAMGTTSGDADMGFDMELWNEVTVDDLFLSLRSYYGQQFDATNFESVVTSILLNTVDTFNANPAQFSGVVLEDGFANEDSNHFAGMEPAAVGAMGKHLYPGLNTFSGDQTGTWMLNAQLQIEGPAPFPFVPSYTAFTPEYYGTFLGTPSPIQDLCPFTTNDVYFNPHGENSRIINGQVVPCTIFVTETGIMPATAGVSDSATAMQMKAKGDSRILTFYLNKGASQVDLFAAGGSGDWDFQVLSQAFMDYANSNTTYPDPDTNYVSPALTLIGNIVNQMQNGLDGSINSSNTRALTVTDIIPAGNYYQFVGDGTAAHPDGYDQERFAFLPYQVNAHKFVIPYYVMTANIANPMTAWEIFQVNIQGINGIGATVTAYDPLNGTALPCMTNPGTANTVSVNLVAADYPYLLVIEEAD